MQHLTIVDLGIILKKRGLRMASSYSEGQYHAYAFSGDQLRAYGRGDEIPEAIEHMLEKVEPPVLVVAPPEAH